MVVCDSTFLHGLKQLEIYPGEAKAEKAAAKKKGSSKAGSKDDPALETEPRDLDTAQTVIKDFNIRDLQNLAPRLQPLNDMGMVLEICILQFFASELLSRVFAREQSPFIFVVGLMCMALCVRHLVQLSRFPQTLDGRFHPRQGSIVLSSILVIWCVVLLVLFLVPPTVLDLDMHEAARGIVNGWRSLGRVVDGAKEMWADVTDRFSGKVILMRDPSIMELVSSVQYDLHEDPASLEPAPAALRILCIVFVSAFSGLFSAMLLMPAQRFAACIASTLNPPASLVASSLLEWRTVPLQPSAWKVALLFCTEAVPVFSLLLWVSCISEGLLGLGARQRAMAQGVAMLLTGVLQMLAVRPLLQGYLSTALERWWLAKNSRSKQKSRKNNAFVTTSLINNTSALLPRVVQQLVGPACIYIVLGCITCDAVGLGKGELGKDEQITLYRAAWVFVPPPLFAHTAARTVGFFALLSQSVYSLIVLGLRRHGVLKSTNV